MDRLQLVLNIHDAELYREFIQPYKANRELNSILIKMMSMYYYDEEIRGIVDTYGEEEVTCEDVKTEALEMIQKAQETLIYINQLTDGVKTTIEDGIDQINEIAVASGGTPAQDTEFGVSLPSFGDIKALQMGQEQPLQADTSQQTKEAIDNTSSSDDTEKSLSVINSEKISHLEVQMNGITEDIQFLKQTMTQLLINGNVQNGHSQFNVSIPAEGVSISDTPVSSVASVLVDDNKAVTPSVEPSVTGDAVAMVKSDTKLNNSVVQEEKPSQTELDEDFKYLSEHMFDDEDEDDTPPTPPLSQTQSAQSTQTGTMNNASQASTPVVQPPIQEVKPVEPEKVEPESTEPEDGSDFLKAFLANGAGASFSF